MQQGQVLEKHAFEEGAARTQATIEVAVRCESVQSGGSRDACGIDVCDVDACGMDESEERFEDGVFGGVGSEECFVGYCDFSAFENELGELLDDEEDVDDPRRLSPRELGMRGEAAACELLRRKDYVILERNWTCPAGEADIVALDEGCIVFVEVKTRAGVERGLPEEAVTARKRAKYERIAGYFLSDYDGPGARVRFDVVGVLALPRGRALARHVVNAFGAGD